MMPYPDLFTGGRRARERHCEKVCEGVALLIRREACYTMGEHPHLSELNERWRREVSGWSDGECWTFLRRIETTWPARMVRS